MKCVEYMQYMNNNVFILDILCIDTTPPPQILTESFFDLGQS